MGCATARLVNANNRKLHDRFDVGGYLDYQGKIFVDRFDANSYLAVSKAMDTFELGRTPEAARGLDLTMYGGQSLAHEP